MSADLQTKLAQIIASGLPIGDWCQDIFPLIQTAAINNQVTITFPPPPKPQKPTPTPFNKLSSLFCGQALTPLLDGCAMVANKADLQSITFTLGTTPAQVNSVSALFNFGSALSWAIADINGQEVTASVTSLQFQIKRGTANKPDISATATGSVTFDGTDLTVKGTFPAGTVTAQQSGSSISLTGLLTQFDLVGLDLPLSDLAFSDLKLSATPAKKTFSLSGAMSSASSADGATISLIDDATDKLSLGISLGQSTGTATIAAPIFSISKNGQTFDGSISGVMLCNKNLALNISANMNTKTSSWSFASTFNNKVTWELINATSTAQTDPSVSLAAIAENVFGGTTGLSIPGLSDVGIRDFSIGYSYSKVNAEQKMTLDGTLNSAWTVDGITFDGEAEVKLSYDAAAAAGKKVSIDVSAEETIDGFDCTFGVDLQGMKAGDAKINATIDKSVNTPSGPKQLNAQGSYAKNSTGTGGTATLTFSGTDLEVFFCWVVESLDQNPFFHLPPPWDEIFQGVDADGSTWTLTYNTGNKKIGLTISSSGDLIDFLGMVTLTSVTGTYTPSGTAGKKGTFKASLSGTFPLVSSPISWQPNKTSLPPVPGHGPAILEVDMLAAGQRWSFPSDAPSTVTGAITKLGNVVSSTATGAFCPSSGDLDYNGSSGWLMAGHGVLLQQVDVEFVFDEPSIYGLFLQVNKCPAGGNPKSKLNVLAGLELEILYRQATPTIGEYKGTLILPDKFRKLNFNAVNITLPQVSLGIYTNGDFSINVGFPANLDFTNSFALNVAEFGGAGGFYYKKLDGLSPPNLPAIGKANGKPIGKFNPITELGIGFKVGLEREFQKGPLSASASIMVEALFQGTFANFTLFSDQSQTEYYSITAAVGIIGQIKGQVKFAIVTASLVVRVQVKAQATLEVYQDTPVTFTAEVDASITVSINCGLFTIHIHCGFSTTYSDEFTLATGSTATPPWVATTTTEMLATSKAPMIAATPASFTWATVAGQTAVNVYLLPKATYAENVWSYVAQYGIILPPASDKTPKDTSYQNLVDQLVLWALATLAGNTTSGLSQSAAEALPLDPAVVSAFLAPGVSDATQIAWPTTEEIQSQFAASLQIALSTDLTPLETLDEKLHFGFFPALPGTETVVTPFTGTTAPTPTGTGPTGPQLTNQQDLMGDYVCLILKSCLQEIVAAFPAGTPQTVSTLMGNGATLCPYDAHDVAKTATRMLLNGKRMFTGNDHATSTSLYQATAQQAALTVSTATPHTAVSVLASPSNMSGWGVTGLSQPNDTTVQAVAQATSLGTKPTVLDCAWFAEDPSLLSSPFQVASFEQFVTVPVDYHLHIGTDTNNGTSLWRLPDTLRTALASEPNDMPTLSANCDTGGNVTPVTGASYNLVIDFKVKKITAPSASGGAPAPVADCYQLVDVDKAGLELLQVVVAALATSATVSDILSNIYVATLGTGTTANATTLSAVDEANNFLASGSYYPVGTKQETSDARAAFARALCLGGLGDTSDNYLFIAGGLPDAAFATNGVATLSAVLELPALASFATHITLPVSVPTASSGISYYLASNETVQKGILKPGTLGVAVTCPAPPTPTALPATPPNGSLAPGIQQSLENLFTIITFYQADTNDNPTNVAQIFPKVQKDGSFLYEHVFDLVPPLDLSLDQAGGMPSAPPAANNPYSVIGQDQSYAAVPTDIFGDWSSALTGTSIKPLYTDEIISPTQLAGLSCQYEFTVNNSIAQIEISWNFTLPDTPNLQPILQHYAQAIYQLEAKTSASGTADMSVTVETSLCTGLISKEQNTTLRDNLKNIYAQLVAQFTTGASTTPVLTSLALKLDASSLCSDLLFELGTTLCLKRTVHVSKENPAFGQITVPIAPKHQPTQVPKVKGKGTPPGSIKAFAESFATAMTALGGTTAPDLALALGASRASEGATTSHQVWVVNQSATGIQPSFVTGENTGGGSETNSYLFAPVPLSNVLLNLPEIGQTDVDLDNMMRQFTRAVDTFCSPEVLGPATSIDWQTTTQIIRSKNKIIELLMPLLTEVYQGTAYDHTSPTPQATAAKDLFEEECEKSLENFYKLGACLVTELNNPVGIGSDNIRVHGTCSVSNAGSGVEGFTLTPGIASISQSGSYMGVGIYPTDISQMLPVEGTLTFSGHQLERNVTPLSVGSRTFAGGDWLKLVDTTVSATCASVEVAAPLRSYPVAPLLGVFNAASMGTVDTSANAEDQIAAAKLWQLNGSYVHSFTEQDEVLLNLHRNKIAANPTATVTPATPNALAIALADFLQAYETLAPSLSQIASNKDQNTLLAFQTKVSSVHSALKDFQPINQNTTPPAGSDTLVWSIEGIEGSGTNGDFSTTVTAKSSPSVTGFLPYVGFPGFTSPTATPVNGSITYSYANGGQALSNDAARAISQRTLQLQPCPMGDADTPADAILNVVDWHAARIGMQVKRNAAFAANFQYQTAEVLNPSRITPYLVNTLDADVSSLTNPAASTLGTHISALIATLLGALESTTQETLLLQLQISMKCPAIPGQTGLASIMLTLPTAMLLPTETQSVAPGAGVPTYGFVSGLVTDINTWLSSNGLDRSSTPSLWAEGSQACLTFEATLFGSSDALARPILKVSGLQLSCTNITAEA